MEFYKTNVVALILLDASIYWYHHRQKVRKAKQSPEVLSAAGKEILVASEATIRQFNWRFLPVYTLVFCADWLQGPYIYTMYKDQKNLSEEVVAYLFTTGFLAAAISATFIGHYADHYGRRKACLFFCIIYSLSCLAVLSSNLGTLFFGRILGGVSTVFMHSVFESWMVTEYHRLHLDCSGGNLAEIFGTMTMLNGGVAIVAGIWAQEIADFTGTQAAPFMSSVCLLCVAFVLITRKWTENYGNAGNKEVIGETKTPVKNGFRVIWEDKRLIALGTASFAFEGSMYLWVFFKFPALRLAHSLAGFKDELQFGMIFAALMCSMMLGSMIFNSCASTMKSWLGSANLIVTAMSMGGLCFIVPVFIRDEWITFWCFCLFEICCGLYYPSIAQQKEKIVDDGMRANIYGILKVPFNIFVVVGLSVTQEGEHHRDVMFMLCGSILIVCALIVGTLLTRESRYGLL